MKKNSFNAVIGLISQIVIMGFGFIIPRVIIASYGSDVNGLMSTITQIFTYLALLEAGISQSSRNALYKFVQNFDKKNLSVVLSASRRYYRRVTIIYFFLVILLSVTLPFILKTQVDYVTILFSVLFEGLTNVVAFFFLNTWICF